MWADEKGHCDGRAATISICGEKYRKGLLMTLLLGLRMALRALRRRPGWCLLIVVLLALGLGATGAALQLIDGLFWRPLSFPEGHRLTSIYGWNAARQRYTTFSYPHYRQLKDHLDTADLAAYLRVSAVLEFEAPELHTGQLVSANYLSLLGVRPALGVVLGEAARETRSIFLGHGLWESRWGSDPGVLGQTVRVNRELYTIIGVAGTRISWRGSSFQSPVLDPP